MADGINVAFKGLTWN